MRAVATYENPIERLDSADVASQTTMNHHLWRLDNCRSRSDNLQFAELSFVKIDPQLVGFGVSYPKEFSNSKQ